MTASRVDGKRRKKRRRQSGIDPGGIDERLVCHWARLLHAAATCLDVRLSEVFFTQRGCHRFVVFN